MDTIRRYIGDFRLSLNFPFFNSGAQRLRVGTILSTPELSVLGFMAAFGIFYFSMSEKPANFEKWKLVTRSSGASESSHISGIKNYKRKNLDMIADFKERYSFKKASTGFYIRDLGFIEKRRMEETESLLTESLPKRMRKRGALYVRPVLLLSEKHQIDPFWVMSIMWTESHFKPTAESHVGARGLMQLMPKTKAWIYNRYHQTGDKLVVENHMADMDYFFNKAIPKTSLKFYKMKLINIELGIIYLKYLLNRFGQNHRLATIAYNMGPGWTRYRLRNKLPVGEKNLYLTKVERAYQAFSKKI